MGNQVNISILTDHFDRIRKEPEAFVEAVSREMNYGTESLVRQVRAKQHADRRGEEYYSPDFPDTDEARWARRHYVTVHRYHHADETQVILTHGNSSWNIEDFIYGVQRGALDLKSNPETYVRIGRDVANELRRQAKELDAALTEHEATQ